MKIYISILLLFISAMSIAQDPFVVMTFNIRVNVASDSLDAWPYRKDHVASQILFHEAKIVGVQEATHDMLTDLQARLPRYKYIGVGREDGKTKGEYSAIFFDTTFVSVEQSSTFWLSKTPEIPGSKDWDAAITRVCSWGRFTLLQSKRKFFVFNTHFDHIGEVARKQSAALIVKVADSIGKKFPAIVLGDFNSNPQSDAYRAMTDSTVDGYFTDSKNISLTPHYGPTGTFNAFKNKETSNLPIDFIFVKGSWKVFKHACISATWQGRFASDHFAVLASVKLLNKRQQ